MSFPRPFTRYHPLPKPASGASKRFIGLNVQLEKQYTRIRDPMPPRAQKTGRFGGGLRSSPHYNNTGKM